MKFRLVSGSAYLANTAGAILSVGKDADPPESKTSPVSVGEVRSLLFFIMPTTRSDRDDTILFVVNNTIHFVNASAPPSAEIPSEAFGLPHPSRGISLNVADHQRLLVLRLPIQIFFPCMDFIVHCQ